LSGVTFTGRATFLPPRVLFASSLLLQLLPPRVEPAFVPRSTEFP